MFGIAIYSSARAVALWTAGALAQPSQEKAGSDSGPTSNSATTDGSGSAGRSVSGAGAGTSTGDPIEGTIGAAGSATANPSSQGNVGPGTNNNSGKQPGGR